MRRKWDGCKSPPPLPGRTRTCATARVHVDDVSKQQEAAAVLNMSSPRPCSPTTKSTTAQLLSFTETVGGGGAARSRRRLAASCSRHRRNCRRATKKSSTYCSSDGENAAVPTCGAALRVLIIQEVTVFASPSASEALPLPLPFPIINVFTLGANQRRHGCQRDINSS